MNIAPRYLVTLIGMLCLTSGLHSGCTSAKTRERAIAYTALGSNMLQQGQYDDAIEHLQKALALDGKNSDALHSMAMAHFAKKSYVQAEHYFRKAENVNPEDPNLFNNIGAMYLELQKCELAVKYLNKALAHPNYRTPVRALNNLGLAYLCKKNYGEAEAAFNKALRVFPQFALAHNNLGRIYFETGKYRDAAQAFQRAIKNDPAYVEPYYYLGTSLTALKYRKQALNVFRACIRKGPTDYFGLKCKEHLNILK